jgi:hypothetical protein
VTRTIIKLCLLTLLVIAGAVGLYHYERQSSVSVQLDEERKKTQQLTEVVAHLQAEQRVADLLVTDQHDVGGVLQTTLLFVEYARDGTPLPPKRFTFVGKGAHVDAMSIVFEGRYLEARDPLRGHSILLFTRLFGDEQTPTNSFHIDDPQQIPLVYRGASPRVSEFEQSLWRDFWRLADDPAYRKSMGVRAAYLKGVAGKFEPGNLYTITANTAGAMILTSEPLKGIYSEALKQRTPAK